MKLPLRCRYRHALLTKFTPAKNKFETGSCKNKAFTPKTKNKKKIDYA